MDLSADKGCGAHGSTSDIVSEFRTLLKHISQYLTPYDCEALAFLGSLPKLGDSDPFNVLLELEKWGVVSHENIGYLIDLLTDLDHTDIVDACNIREFQKRAEQAKVLFQSGSNDSISTSDYISDFKRLLAFISEHLTPYNARSLAYIGGLPSPSNNLPHNPLDVLMELEKKGVFSHSNVNPLIGLLTCIHRVDIINTYKLHELEMKVEHLRELAIIGDSTPTSVTSEVLSEFRKMLTHVSDYLQPRVVQSLAYMFDLPSTSVNTPLEVLIELERRNVFSYENVDPLIRLLDHFQRGGMVSKYKEWAEHAGVRFETNTSDSDTTDVLHIFRKMLTKISESLNRENIQALAYICGIPFVHGNTSLQNLDVLIEFEKKGVISYDNVDPLIGLLTDVHRLDVAHDVKTYQEWSQHAGVQLTTSGSSTTLDIIRKFHVLVVRISDHLTISITQTLEEKYGLPRSSDSVPNKALYVLSELQKRGVFSHDNVDPLIELLTSMDLNSIIKACGVIEYKEWAEHVEEQMHIAAIEEAIRNKGKLDHTSMQGVFLGPARSGKSSLIKRLLREKIDRSSASTGAAEKVIQVNVKKSSSIPLSVFDSVWLRLTYGSEAVRLMMLTVKYHQNQPDSGSQEHHHESQANVGHIASTQSPQRHSEASSTENVIPGTPAQEHGPYLLQGPMHLSLEMPAGYNAPKQTFQEALRNSGVIALRQHFDGSWTLYLSDTGGQMEFQEILPLLVSGPSLFFIVFPLNRDLNELFMIEYQLPDGERSQPYQSSLTLMEAILQSLATIAAMGTFTYKGKGSDIKLKPKVLLVGTHKDLLDPATAQAKIEEIDSHLRQTITSTSYYRDGLVEFATASQLVFTVNNLAEDDSDFALIRSRVNLIANHDEYRMSIPTHWLIFSIVIRGLSSRVISYDECRNVAQQCGIDDEEELHEALWFLHTRMGVIRYFRYGDVSKIVVTDPQLLYDKITKVMIKTFTFEHGMHLFEEFRKKGIFAFEDLSRIDKSEDLLLTHSRFIELLEHLRIVVPIGDGRLLIPCVWTHADKSRYPPKQHSAVPTLAIVFDCGYCPKGVTGALIKYLMTNEMKSRFTWKLQMDEIFRDQVTFFIGPNLITLCMYPTHFEVVCAPSTDNTEAICSVRDTCQEACKTVQKAIHKVSKDANLTCCCQASFYCTLCKSHIAELKQHDGKPCHLYCKETRQVCDLPNGFEYWLEAQPQKQAEMTEPSNTTLTLPPALKLVSSLSSEWKTLGVYLFVDGGKLNEIETDYKKSSDCLREMLIEWLKSDTPCPTWETLATEVECINPTIAEKIRNLYCC